MKDKIIREADFSNYEALIGFIENFMSKAEIEKGLVLRILTACEEVIVNIIKYAYPSVKGEIEIDVDFTENNLTIIFTDFGNPFNPLEKEDANVELGIDERRAGGLGIFLVKKIMDDVKYEYTSEKNILTIGKKIED